MSDSTPAGQLTAELNDLADVLATAFPREIPPSTLYHYTSPVGFLGIVQKRRVWATDVLHMNDSAEMSYGLGILASVIDEKKKEALPPGSPGEFLLRSVTSVLQPKPCTYSIACFSERRDLLSQWRAYAGDGAGYAVGFASSHVREMRPPADWPGKSVDLVKVVYSPDTQREIIRKIVEPVVQTLARFWSTNPADLAKSEGLSHGLVLLEYALRPALVGFKNPGFEEEAEWRAVLRWQKPFEPHPAKPLEFRPTKYGLTPYIELEFGQDAIVEVVHGPKLDREIAAATTEVAFQRHGLAQPTFSHSLTSYR